MAGNVRGTLAVGVGEVGIRGSDVGIAAVYSGRSIQVEILPQGVVAVGALAAVGVGHGGGVVLIGGLGGGGFQEDAGPGGLLQLGAGAVSGGVIGGGDGDAVIGGFGHVVGVVVLVGVGAVAAGDLLGEVGAVVGVVGVAVAGGGGGLQVALGVVGIGLDRLFHQGDVVEIGVVDVEVVGQIEGDGGDGFAGLLGGNDAGGVLPVGVIVVEGEVVIVRRGDRLEYKRQWHSRK